MILSKHAKTLQARRNSSAGRNVHCLGHRRAGIRGCGVLWCMDKRTYRSVDAPPSIWRVGLLLSLCCCSAGHRNNVVDTSGVAGSVPHDDIPRQLGVAGFINRDLIEHSGNDVIVALRSSSTGLQRCHRLANAPFDHSERNHLVHHRPPGGHLEGARHIDGTWRKRRPGVQPGECVPEPGVLNLVERGSVCLLDQMTRRAKRQKVKAVARESSHRGMFGGSRELPVPC
mmetsp:Transcript_32530/g.98039  ORF Transcript_32530/g.98039 Transcript_32530/m.98039 type:complete len:228 (-) Transcript_32530:1145-1828(-)